jgi:hypothetical protein
MLGFAGPYKSVTTAALATKMALPLLLNQRYLIPLEVKSSLSNKESSQSKSCAVGLRYLPGAKWK